MRTRYQNDTPTYGNIGLYTYTTYGLPKWTSTGSGTTGSSSTYQKSYGYSEITDDPSPYRGVKPVTHTRREWSRHDVSSYDESTATNRYIYTGPGCHWSSWGLYGVLDFSNIAVSYPQSVSQLAFQARDAFFNRNQVDNLLNIVESGQFISSLKSLNDLVQRIRGGQYVSTHVLSGLRRRRGGIRLLDLSNLFLMWQFGFAPLISDMQKMARAVKSIKDDMERASRNAGKPHTEVATSHGTLVVTSGGSGFSATEPSPLNGSWWHPMVQPLHPPVLRVGVRGINTVKYQSDAFRKLDYLLTRFLSAGPASFVWERIPFSFVVDWVVNTSDIINQLDNTLTGGSKKITDAWMSEKYDVYISAVKHRTSAWTSSEDGKAMVQNRLSYYHREPYTHSQLTESSGRFGKKQVLLSAALLHQLVANLKRVR